MSNEECKKIEYKVGDKVRIVTKRNGHWNSNGEMDHWMGKVMTIRAVGIGYEMEEDRNENGGTGWGWRENDFAEKIEKNMPKYKVGDKVRIVTKRGDHWNPEGKMDHWMGKVMTIRDTVGDWYRMEEDRAEYKGDGWSWKEEDVSWIVIPGCATCRYRDVRPECYPCTGCKRHSGLNDLWEYKEVKDLSGVNTTMTANEELKRILNTCYGKAVFDTPKPIWDLKTTKDTDPLKQVKLYQYITTSNPYWDKQFTEYIQNDVSITQQIYNKIRKDLFNMKNVYIVVGDSAYPVYDAHIAQPITGEGFQNIHASANISPFTKRGISSLMKSSIKIAEIPTITNVIYNNPATIVMWSDGTKTVVRADGEKYDPEKGLAMAMCKKHAGNKRDYYHTFLHWLKKAPKKEYKSEVETAYGLLNGVLSNPKATKDDMTAAMQEALGFLGEALDD